MIRGSGDHGWIIKQITNKRVLIETLGQVLLVVSKLNPVSTDTS